MVDYSRRFSRRCCLLLFTLLTLGSAGFPLKAQPGASTSSLPKPKKYENRVLASEKSTTTKMNVVKKWNQDLNTRFNFVFNANTKLEQVVANAKQTFRDDYAKLLPFYNYSLDETSQQQSELDSVIHKCNNGILLHDLRGNWIDDLYLLMGKAYFFRKEIDSAAIAFQYINYAFQPRSKDEVGFDKFVGSNLNTSGNAYTISTPESRSALVRAVKHMPARNMAIIWLIRTLMEADHMGEAWGIIETLERDKNFPARLLPELREMQAYWYYRDGRSDSAAVYLEQALPAAGNAQERARWEYLAAQLYERAGRKEDAGRMLDKAIQHTTDPIMEAYARIAEIRLATGENEAELIRKNIDALMSMARKARYEEYRHIIYYVAGKLELRRFDSAAAMRDYLKSIAASTADQDFRNRTYIELAGLAFDAAAYPMAKAYYDSADFSKVDPREAESLQQRSLILADIVFHLENIRIEDSLQEIALMPEADREAYLKALSKKLRKAKGLQEEEASSGGQSVQNTALAGNQPADLFTSNAAGSGEWYFYNTNLKSQGRRQFEAKWGNRPNQDNWRRMAAVKAQANAVVARQNQDPDAPAPVAVSTKAAPEDVSMAGLRANLPLTAEAMESSRDTVEQSLYRLGKTFHDRLGNCAGAIRHYESLLNRYPDTRYQEEALFVLTRCYGEAGNTAKASFYKGFLTRNHAQGKYLKFLNNPAKLKADTESFNTAATATYDKVYTLFIEGKFNDALALKQQADSMYGENHWSPQLLYIESVYYIRQRQDSLALATLNKILVLYPQSNMNPKVAALMDVVSRREEIESYLNNLQVARVPEDSIIRITEPVATVPAPPAQPEPQRPREKETVAPRTREAAPPVSSTGPPKTVKADTASLKVPVQAPAPKKGYQFDPKTAHGVLLVLDKVDPVYVNEAKNALARYNREKFYQQPLAVTPQVLTDDIRLVYVGDFPDAPAALDYLEKTKAASASEIFPWLPAGKYSYLLVTPENLELLKAEKNLEAYRQFLKQALPGKF